MKNGKASFKEYAMEQISLLPPGPKELIPEDHLFAHPARLHFPGRYFLHSLMAGIKPG
jgi:hypothetical protein